MSDFRTDEETVELIKSWFKRNGSSLLFTILLAAILSFGWRYWQNERYNKSIEASAGYEQLLQLIAEPADKNAIATQAEHLMSNYTKTPYAMFAALLLSKQEVANKDYARAVEHLQWAVDHTRDPSWQQIAKLRMARVLIADGKPEQAISTLEQTSDETYAPVIAEIKGDALREAGKVKQAIVAYETAAAEMPGHQLLAMKLNDLKRGDSSLAIPAQAGI